MSDNITKEQLEMQMLRLQLAQQGQGGISIAGIQKHWQILGACLAFAVAIYQGGTLANALENRIATLEKAPVRLETMEKRVTSIEAALEQLKGLPATLEIIRQQGDTNKRQIEQILSSLNTAEMVREAERKVREAERDQLKGRK